MTILQHLKDPWNWKSAMPCVTAAVLAGFLWGGNIGFAFLVGTAVGSFLRGQEVRQKAKRDGIVLPEDI